LFSTFFETRQQTVIKIGRKDDPYLEGIEAKFPRDPLRGFGGRGICDIFINGLTNKQP